MSLPKNPFWILHRNLFYFGLFFPLPSWRCCMELLHLSCSLNQAPYVASDMKNLDIAGVSFHQRKPYI